MRKNDRMKHVSGMDSWEERLSNVSVWDFRRVINKNIKVFGEIKWERLGESRVYRYTESGTYMNNKFSKVYFFDFERKEIHFDDSRFFVRFPTVLTTSRHLCEKDVYEVSADHDSMTIVVKGPFKSFKTETRFNPVESRR